MNILIIGSGAREHALAKTIARTSPNARIFCIGSSHNPGIHSLCDAFIVGNILQNETILQQAITWKIDMAIIGPEAPLACGLADCLQQQGIAVVGPTKQLAQLETSKAFTRHLLQQFAIPGSPEFQVFHTLEGVENCLKRWGPQGYVIKADGLMGGKGVKVAGEHLHSLEEALQFCTELTQQQIPFLIEEKLEGQEFSFICMTDGHTLLPLPLVQDHKRAFDNDQGPNTGGMGSYSCADHRLPFLTPQDIEQAFATNLAVLQALQEHCNERYNGILYGSFMATKDGVRLIEYNARFGDPEAINILPLFEGDFADCCFQLTQGKLHTVKAAFKPLATVCKYAVPIGYPDNALKNIAIDTDSVANKDCLYYAAVDERNGQLFATGSRAIAVLGQAADLQTAEQMAETEIARIQGELFYRRDIGTQPLIQRKIQHMEQLRREVNPA